MAVLNDGARRAQDMEDYQTKDKERCVKDKGYKSTRTRRPCARTRTTTEPGPGPGDTALEQGLLQDQDQETLL